MQKSNLLLILVSLFLISCQFKLKPNEETDTTPHLKVQRFDLLQYRYLTTGDYSALQQMNTDYPLATRVLIEDMLQLGEISDPGIYAKFLNYYQDSTLQVIIADAEQQYSEMDDVDKQLEKAFNRLTTWLPDFPMPVVYAQLGALGQSIVVGQGILGISLEKYLGTNYPLYNQYYTPKQRNTMTRQYIVPDCITFYLLNLYPMIDYQNHSQEERNQHLDKIMWVANQALGESFFKGNGVKKVQKYMQQHPKVTVKDLLRTQKPNL